MKTLLTALAIVILAPTCVSAAIADFGTWTLVEDPADPNFSAIQTANSVTLSAGAGAIGAGTDIGFQSVNGNTVATSNSGSYFDSAADFSVAIDYDLSFNSASGFLGLGFGIGEDGAGVNSAGVGMLTSSGTPFLTFAGAARVNDVNQAPIQLGLTPSTLSGTLFAQYTASSGDIVIGAAATTGANTPTVSGTYVGIQNQWNDAGLLASFFIRSDGPLPGSGWNGGDGSAVFSNFRVLSGTPVAIPEPSTLAALLFATGVIISRRRR